jgi:hypothetical protein
MGFIEESEQARSMRRIYACTHTMYSLIDELSDPDDVELRGDLVIAAEDLYDVAMQVVDMARDIAWQYTPIPTSEYYDD